MKKYVAIRCFMMIFVLVLVAMLLFSLLFTVPGDPARQILGPTASEEAVAALRDEMGLNDPFFVQLGRYLYGLFTRFDLGTSYQTKTPVMDDVVVRLPISLWLSVLSILVAVVIGVPAGIISAVKQYSWLDKLANIISVVGVSMPSFWLGLELSLLFSLTLRWLPATGFNGPRYWVLPAITLGFSATASFMRFTRSSMLEVIRMDYIRTARAKGQSNYKVIMHHALKNAMIPIITNIGSQLSGMLGGAIVVEMVFSIAGMGSYLITGINNRDYPVILGGVLALSIISSIINLAVDIVYGFVDPRIRSRYSK